MVTGYNTRATGRAEDRPIGSPAMVQIPNIKALGDRMRRWGTGLVLVWLAGC
ncbi:MAG: hypothetical protein AAGF11_40135 [Myxococcota bacterium]